MLQNRNINLALVKLKTITWPAILSHSQHDYNGQPLLLGRIGQVQEQICLCVQLHLKLMEPSENVGCWQSEALDTLIGWVLSCMTILISGVLVRQRGVSEGWNTMCATELYGFRLYTTPVSADPLKVSVYEGAVPAGGVSNHDCTAF